MYYSGIDDLRARQSAIRVSSLRWMLVPLAILAITFLLRWPYIGQPDIFVDEQFYLLVAHQMFDGALPYVMSGIVSLSAFSCFMRRFACLVEMSSGRIRSSPHSSSQALLG